MNPYLHELLSRLRSRSVWVVLVVLGVAVALGVSTIEGDVPSVQINGVGFDYYADDAYHFEIWAVDVSGHPVSGVQVTLSIAPQPNFTTFPPPPPPPVVFNTTVTTDSSGFIEFVVPVAPGAYAATVGASYAAVPRASMTGLLANSFYFGPVAVGEVNLFESPVNVVALGDYLDQDQLLVVWAGANGTAPIDDSVEACAAVVSSFAEPEPSNCTGLTDVTSEGPLSGFLTLVPYPSLSMPAVGMFESLVVFVEIVNATGGVVAINDLQGPSGPIPAGVTTPAYLVTGPGPGLVMDLATTFGLFVPLAAFALAYWGYARPRVSGTVDMVLVRPVTRRGLFLVRYASVALLMGVVTTAAYLLLDLAAATALGQPIPPGFLLALIGITTAGSIAFAGLIFLLAHLFRSAGPIIGIGTTLLLLFSLFWSLVQSLPVLVEGPVFNSAQLLNFGARSQLFAPPQLPSAVVGILTLQSSYLEGGNRLVYQASGVTPAVVAAVAVAWIVLPFALTLWCVARRD